MGQGRQNGGGGGEGRAICSVGGQRLRTTPDAASELGFRLRGVDYFGPRPELVQFGLLWRKLWHSEARCSPMQNSRGAESSAAPVSTLGVGGRCI